MIMTKNVFLYFLSYNNEIYTVRQNKRKYFYADINV